VLKAFPLNQIMKIKLLFITVIFISFSALIAQSAELAAYMEVLLAKNFTYQQALSRYEQEKAFYTIEQSLSWFDINLQYQKYDNDLIRDELETALEHSDIKEKDIRKSIEIKKQLFPKDFDQTIDAIGSRLNLLRYKQDLKLSNYNATSEIIDDFIKWYEAENKIGINQSRLAWLYQQNLVLEELHDQNLVDAEILIQNLEDINDTEAEISLYRDKSTLCSEKYGAILTDFLTCYQAYMKLSITPDSLTFQQQISAQTSKLQNELNQVSRLIHFNYYHFYLPEINLSLSYNWRETDQDWKIVKNSILKNKTINQKEEFPQGEIELSLPFNMFSNTSGKLALLKAFDRETKYKGRDMQLAWQKFAITRLSSLQAAKSDLKRKSRLSELYAHQLLIQQQRYREEPSLLGGNPEQKLQQDTNKAKEAELDYQLAEMRLYKEIYLINRLGEDNQ